MSEKKYVIDSYYDFDTVADGPRPSSSGSSGIHLRLEHDEVMEMGEYFYKEDPSEMDYDYNFGIKDILDEILADRLAAELEEEWEREHMNQDDDEEDEDFDEDDEFEDEDEDDDFDEDEEDEEPDFYEMAYDQMGEMYHVWDEKLKQDCIDYYLAHKDD